MKKWMYTLMAAIVATAMVACTSDDDGEGGGSENGGGNGGSVSEDCTIEMTLDYGDEISSLRIGTLKPEEITVDWGDGTVETLTTEPYQTSGNYWLENYYAIRLEHEYGERVEDMPVKITGKKIAELHSYGIRFNEVDVTRCETLEYIKLAATMTTLDVSHQPKLVVLDLSDSPSIETLNLGDKPELVYLHCSPSKNTTLDLSTCKKLRYLHAYSMENVTSLDLSNCQELEWVDLHCRTIDNIPVYNKLSSLKMGSNKKLTNLECNGNRLISLDVSGCTNLHRLECQENLLTSLNVEGCESLRWLDCSFNQFTEDAMTEVYEALPDVGDFGNGSLYFDKYEYGDIAIAHEKGWRIYVDD